MTLSHFVIFQYVGLNWQASQFVVAYIHVGPTFYVFFHRIPLISVKHCFNAW